MQIDFKPQPFTRVVFCLASDFVPLSKAVQLLGVSSSTLYRYEKAGLIKAYRTAGGHRRYSVKELTSFLEKMRRGDFSNQSQSSRHEKS
jgi:excisionase family DNA binding protein